MKQSIRCPDCGNTIILDFRIANYHDEITDRGRHLLAAIAKGESYEDLSYRFGRSKGRIVELAQQTFAELFPEKRKVLIGGAWNKWVRANSREVLSRTELK